MIEDAARPISRFFTYCVLPRPTVTPQNTMAPAMIQPAGISSTANTTKEPMVSPVERQLLVNRATILPSSSRMGSATSGLRRMTQVSSAAIRKQNPAVIAGNALGPKISESSATSMLLMP